MSKEYTEREVSLNRIEEKLVDSMNNIKITYLSAIKEAAYETLD